MTFPNQIAKDRGQPATVRVGIVVSVQPLVVHVQGTDFLNVGVLADYVPIVGQSAVLLGQSAVSADGSSWLALGVPTSADTAGAPATDGIQIMAVAQSNNTGVFVNITGVSFTFVKRRAESRVLMHLAGSGFSTVAGAVGEYAVLITSSTGVPAATDNVIASFFYNAAATHASWSGFRYLAGLPAGTYTVQGRFRLSAGASFISFDVNDRISLGFTEVE